MYKKFFFALALALWVSASAFGQQWMIGFRGGADIATLHYQNTTTNNLFSTYNLVGFTASIPVEYQFSKRFSLQTELSVVQKGLGGLKWTDDQGFPIAGNPKLIFEYIEVPLLAKFNFGNGKLQFNTLIGTSLGYEIGQYVAPLSLFPPSSDKTTMQTQKTDFSLNGGLGMSYNLRFGKIFVEERYQMSLTSPEPNSKGRVFYSSAGIMFKI